MLFYTLNSAPLRRGSANLHTSGNSQVFGFSVITQLISTGDKCVFNILYQALFEEEIFGPGDID